MLIVDGEIVNLKTVRSLLCLSNRATTNMVQLAQRNATIVVLRSIEYYNIEMTPDSSVNLRLLKGTVRTVL